ncbi:uncharacterized protein ALTATR162_LOCUS840 [Alternaria atra]|uniref:Ketopantoate reductase N-terminal domain-containing protein n=1 Tax=Alternaria atra TaxID=119953 RepID=A0A8J2HSQ4_9PLEO|nr:uncharacterized protein ALTATR162_LOCUS840 [Alternaria atra]CAG5141035.1 unnamed protein product [Alternaria atra]
MPKPKVLIVGCGAVGLFQGYFLSAGADITYLVRPGRRSAFAPPKRLYSYKDDELYTFESYTLIEDISEVEGEIFAFVFDTLDGYTARSEAGVATLSSVGKLLNEEQNADCFVVYDAIGLDIELHYARTMRIASTRLFFAVSLIAHQPTPKISVPATANKDLITRADLLYSHGPPNIGLVAFNTHPALTAKLETIYNVNGRLTIRRIPALFSPWAPLLGMLHLMTWNVDGFGPFESLRRNNELWTLMLRAQAEILTLPRFGWTGWFLSFIFGSWATEKLNIPLFEGAKPLNCEEFNLYHHGGKVVQQDLKTLEELIADGERVGKKMPALKEVVGRARKSQSSQIL